MLDLLTSESYAGTAQQALSLLCGAWVTNFFNAETTSSAKMGQAGLSWLQECSLLASVQEIGYTQILSQS